MIATGMIMRWVGTVGRSWWRGCGLRGRRWLVCGLVGLLTGAGAAWAEVADEEFTGWEGLRVVQQDGAPSRLRVADLDGNGREELIVVNTRQARLEIVRWLEPGARQEAFETPTNRPNELPMAAELERVEVPLEHLPEDVVVLPGEADEGAKLLVLASVPNRLLLLEREAEEGEEADRWRRAAAWNLLPGSYVGQGALLLVRVTAEGEREALVSCREGIQRVTLKRGSRPRWMEPREEQGRADWWLADISGNGELDLVEWTRQTDLALRWYESVDGRLLPAQPLHERSVDGVAVMPKGASSADAAELLLLGGTQQGAVRRHQLGQGEASELGQRWALALAGGGETPWCGVQLDEEGDEVLVAAPPDRPRLVSYGLSQRGWGEAKSYPSVGDVRALAAPPGQPGTLLLLTRDAGELHVSRWQEGRFSYPKPWRIDEEDAEGEGAADRRVLAMERVGATVWWAQRVGADVDLYVWPGDAREPMRTRFEGVGERAQRARWLGGERLLVLDQYARAPRLVVRVSEGDTSRVASHEPAHLQGADLDHFQLFEVAGELRLGRLTGGVLQWLDEELHPDDQVMLPEGQALVSYVPVSSGEAWVLQRGGEFVHRLVEDAAGLPEVTESIRLPGGRAASLDPVLGLMLHTRFGVTRLAAGEPWELQLLQSLDARVGRPTSVREATVHRLFTTDLTGDGRADLVLCDDQRRELTVLIRQGDELVPAISWQVYEDKRYPYGQSPGGDRSTEPRALAGLDLDGDGKQDLAMLAHDRLVIYLGREPVEAGEDKEVMP